MGGSFFKAQAFQAFSSRMEPIPEVGREVIAVSDTSLAERKRGNEKSGGAVAALAGLAPSSPDPAIVFPELMAGAAVQLGLRSAFTIPQMCSVFLGPNQRQLHRSSSPGFLSVWCLQMTLGSLMGAESGAFRRSHRSVCTRGLKITRSGPRNRCHLSGTVAPSICFPELLVVKRLHVVQITLGSSEPVQGRAGGSSVTPTSCVIPLAEPSKSFPGTKRRPDSVFLASFS